MSFSVEFYAQSAEDAFAILQEEPTLPLATADFIRSALRGCFGSSVYVKAYGHLYTSPGSYDVSSQDVQVRKITIREPKPAVAAAPAGA